MAIAALLVLFSIGIITDNIATTLKDDGKTIPPFDSKKAKIVKISTIEDSEQLKINIMPSEIIVDKNTVIIWVNFIDGPEINIKFDDPKATSAATTDLKSFYIDDEGVFSAKYMPFIATCSMRFIESGEFSYSITSSDEKEAACGKVIVK